MHLRSLSRKEGGTSEVRGSLNEAVALGWEPKQDSLGTIKETRASFLL